MSGISSSTNTPFDNLANKSSTANLRQNLGNNYHQPNIVAEPKSDSKVTGYAIQIGTIIITGVVVFFTTIGAVKDDISENKTKVSVLESEMVSAKEKAAIFYPKLEKVYELETSQAVLKNQFSSFEKRLDRLVVKTPEKYSDGR